MNKLRNKKLNERDIQNCGHALDNPLFATFHYVMFQEKQIMWLF